MNIQPINFSQSFSHSGKSAKTTPNFRGESTKIYDMLSGQACSHIEKAKEELTRHIADLADKGDWGGVIRGKETLINVIKNDGRPKAEQDHDIFMLKQGMKEYVDKL